MSSRPDAWAHPAGYRRNMARLWRAMGGGAAWPVGVLGQGWECWRSQTVLVSQNAMRRAEGQCVWPNIYFVSIHKLYMKSTMGPRPGPPRRRRPVPVAGRFRTKHRSFGSLRPSSERIRSVIAPPMTAIIAVLGGMAIRISVIGKLVIT